MRMVSQRGIFLALFLGLIPYGAVHDLPKLLVTFVIGLTMLVALRIEIKGEAIKQLSLQAWILLTLLVAYALLQSLTFDNNPLAHPFWQTAGELAHFTHGAISVEPSLTRFGLFSLIPPFLLFIGILHAFQGDDEAWRLIKFLGGVGFGFTLYGLAQAQFFPDYVLLRELERPNTVFTSTLINRNHAATIAGLASLMFLAIIIHLAKGIPLMRFPKAVFLPSRLPSKRRWPLVIWSLGLFLSFIALFMTQSRGGLGATVIAWGVLAPPLLARALSQPSHGHMGFQGRRYFKLRRILLMVFLVVVSIGFVSIYAEGTLFRLADTNTEVGRFCNFPSMWRAYLDNWLFGSGFATFEAIFPIYRNPECGVTGIWTQAHNFWLEGLMGFGLIFVPAAVFSLWRLIDSYRIGVQTRRSQRFASHIGIAAVLLVSLHSLVDFSLQIPGAALYASACLASLCVLSLGRLLHKQ